MADKLYLWQEECLESWFAHGSRGCVGAVTGAGKTVLALFAAAELEKRCSRPLRVKVVTPTVAIMRQWSGALQAFLNQRGQDGAGEVGCQYGGFRQTGRRYTVYVINSARHTLAQQIRMELEQGYEVLLIADECHHYGSRENRRIFEFWPLPELYRARFHALGLSATPEGDMHGGESWALGTEIYRYGFELALEQQRVCPFAVLQVGLSFSAAELERYTEYTEQMSGLLARLLKSFQYLKKLSGGAFFAALKSLAGEAEDSEGGGTAKTYLELSYQRKALVCMASARAECLNRLLTQLDPDERILIFCERIEQAEQVYQKLAGEYGGRLRRYHSGMDKRQRREALCSFRDGEARILISCRALDEGIDIPGATVGIVLSGASVQRQRIQRLGRILRTAPGKERAALYYFYVKESAEEPSYLELGETGQTASLFFDTSDAAFSCSAYEDAAMRELDAIRRRLRSAAFPEEQREKILREARLCFLEGIARPDWLTSRAYCQARRREAKNTHEQNYWRCMERLCR
ncbi:MAG: DEAD/DEAH box helicase [Eubacteriales bacterium]|nr:DEAD/DEAH box helicase [Eubacteriales bacterium]